MKRIKTLSFFTQSNRPKCLAFVSGSLSGILGLLTLFGWYTRNISLIQLCPAFVPMQYNTGLGFLLCGLGLVAVTYNARWIAMTLGALGGIIGLLTLIEYVCSVNLGIDQLLMKDFLEPQALYPGRMAPNTALSFTLVGAALIACTQLRTGTLTAIGILGGLVIALGSVALFGHLSGIETAYGWGQLTRMAATTALAFVVLGIGITGYAWRRSSGFAWMPAWTPTLAGIAVITGGVLIWQAMEAEEAKAIKRQTRSALVAVQSEILSQMRSRNLALVRMAQRWSIRPPLLSEWEADAQTYIAHDEGYQAIKWVDPTFHARRIVPLDGNQAALDLDMTFESRRKNALETAKNSKDLTLTRLCDLVQGGKGFLACAPIYANDQFKGFILGVYRADSLFGAILDKRSISPGYSITLLDGDERMYQRGPDIELENNRWVEKNQLELYGVTWTARVSPTPAMLAEMQSSKPEMVLIGGLVVGVLLGLTLRLTETVQKRAHTVEAINQRLEDEIADRHRAEEELHLRDRAIQSASNGIVIADAAQDDHPIIDVNNAFEDITGYAKEEILGRNCRFLQGVDRDQPDLEKIKKALEEGCETHAVLRNYRKDGSRFWNELYIAPVRDDEGQVTHFIGVLNDITERKRAEQTMRENEARYRAVVENQTELVCRYQTDTKLTFVNEAYCRYFGKTREELIGVSFLSLLPESAREVAKQHVESLIKKPRVLINEHEVIQPDGGLGWQQWVDYAIFDADGRIVEFQAVGRDITERKEAERRLEESERRFRTLTTFPPVVIFQTDAQGNCTFVNGYWCQLTGMSFDESLGFGWLNALVPEDRQRISDEWAKVVKTGDEYEFEYRLLKADGEVRWTNGSVMAFRDEAGQVTGYIGMAADITERKQTEEALRESEAKYRALVEQIPDAFTYVTLHDDLNTGLYVSPQIQSILGFLPEEFCNGSISFANLVYPEDRGLLESEVEHLYSEGNVLNCQYRVTAKDGRVVWLHHRGQMVCDKEGHPLFFHGVATDITKIKETQGALRRAKRLASIAPLAAGIAHEINNPVASILVAAKLGLQQSRKSAKNRQVVEDCLNHIVEDAKRCGQIVKSVLQFAREEETEKWPADLNRTLRRARDLIRSYADQHDITVNVEIADNLPQVYMNPLEIEQVLINVMRNAIEASKPDTVVTVGSTSAQNKAIITIADQGHGMTQQQVDHIFDPLYTTRQTAGGTGLGLSIAYAIISDHGGGLDVQTQQERGTVITIQLPTTKDGLLEETL